jgi:site-specific DNA recombinase
MWMGGQPSLGYDVKDRKLIVNTTEAETVRQIFRRCIELKSVRELKEDLDGAGIVSKVRTASDGSRYGGRPIARGALYLMLQNRIYRGEIVHKGKSYPGEHEAIVDEALWNSVQAILSENRVDRAIGVAGREGSLLTGILFDAQGGRMSPTHANKRGTATAITSRGHCWTVRRTPKPRAKESRPWPLNPLSSVAFAAGLSTPLASFGPFNMPYPTP